MGITHAHQCDFQLPAIANPNIIPLDVTITQITILILNFLVFGSTKSENAGIVLSNFHFASFINEFFIERAVDAGGVVGPVESHEASEESGKEHPGSHVKANGDDHGRPARSAAATAMLRLPVQVWNGQRNRMSFHQLSFTVHIHQRLSMTKNGLKEIYEE